MEEHQEAMAEETSRGTVWRWPHSPKSYLGLRAAPYQVRNIPEKEVVVILCQDGISGYDFEVDDDVDDYNEEQAIRDKFWGDELQKQAGDLLRFRWEEVSLMDAIVDSPAFAKGDYKGSLEAGFKSVDEKVMKFVSKMPREMGNRAVDWSEPVVWQALYNSAVVIITPTQVYTAGCGSFTVHLVSNNDVTCIESIDRVMATSLKTDLATGVSSSDFPSDYDIKETRKVTLESTFQKHELKEEDECIIVELSSPVTVTRVHSMVDASFEDWGAALTSITTGVCWGAHYESILLALKPTHELSACRTEIVPSPVLPSPVLTYPAKARPSSFLSPSNTVVKRIKIVDPQPQLLSV